MFLEGKLQSDLDVARRVRLRSDLAEGLRRNRSVWSGKLDGVEKIVDFEAELRRHAMVRHAETEILDEHGIDVASPICADVGKNGTDIAEREGRRDGKHAGVEPLGYRRTGQSGALPVINGRSADRYRESALEIHNCVHVPVSGDPIDEPVQIFPVRAIAAEGDRIDEVQSELIRRVEGRKAALRAQIVDVLRCSQIVDGFGTSIFRKERKCCGEPFLSFD